MGVNVSVFRPRDFIIVWVIGIVRSTLDILPRAIKQELYMEGAGSTCRKVDVKL